LRQERPRQVRRIKFSLASAFPYTDVFRTAWAVLDRAAR
jgi:hypothetical protein